MGRNSLLTMIAVLILATTRQGGAAGDPNVGQPAMRSGQACLAPDLVSQVCSVARAGHSVLLPASMMGDRAFVIFAAPAGISAFIGSRC